jgi:hypothetical protein
MTQLIENKPRRRALIATLSHFSRSRRALQPLVSRLQRQESNRNNPRLEAYLTPAKSMRAAALIATKPHIADPLFCALTSVFTPMKQPCRSRFRGAPALRYPPMLLAGLLAKVTASRVGLGRIHKNNEGKC